jgi:hypothetical protein
MDNHRWSSLPRRLRHPGQVNGDQPVGAQEQAAAMSGLMMAEAGTGIGAGRSASRSVAVQAVRKKTSRDAK